MKSKTTDAAAVHQRHHIIVKQEAGVWECLEALISVQSVDEGLYNTTRQL